jgi:hypothetical protein
MQRCRQSWYTRAISPYRRSALTSFRLSIINRNNHISSSNPLHRKCKSCLHRLLLIHQAAELLRL